MNERFRELAFQAMSINQKVSDDSFFVEVSKLNEFEKFADLVVKECADIALKSGNVANKNIAAKIESERIYHKIKEHFGVEE